MTVVDTPTFIQAGGETAEETRRSLGAMLGLRGGVVGSGDLRVTQNGTPNMSVDVAGGQVIIPGTEGTYQGFYICENRGSTDVTIDAADSTNDRRDLIVAVVKDSGYSGADDEFAIEAVKGTASGSPVDPDVPENAWVLARVLVGAGVTSITQANISDLRAGGVGYTGQNGRAAALGGVVVCSSGLRPTVGVYEGMVAFETDTNSLIYYDGSSWQYQGRSTWTNTTPTLKQNAEITKTLHVGRWTRLSNGLIVFQAKMTCIGSGTLGFQIKVSLPVFAAEGQIDVGTFRVRTASGTIRNYVGTAETEFGGQTVQGSTSDGLYYLGDTDTGLALKVGDIVYVNCLYEPAS